MKLKQQPPRWFWLACGFIVLFLLVWWFLDLLLPDSAKSANTNVVPSATASTTADRLPENVRENIIEGSKFHNGDGPPNPAMAKDGDYYIRRDNGVIYEKVSGQWQTVFVPPTSSSEDDIDYLAIYEAND